MAFNFQECIVCGNGKVENTSLMLCASCSLERRKSERQARKTKVIVPVKKVTEKRAKQNREYLEMREQFLEQYPVCQIGGCNNKSTQIHHRAGRSNDLLTDPENFLAICDTCHIEITKNSAAAIENGYSKLRSI